MSYCTVGDHYHEGGERPLPSGTYKGHAACQTCFEIEFFNGLADEALTSAKRLEATRERLKKAFCQKCKTSWRRCVDPVEHSREKTVSELMTDLKVASLASVEVLAAAGDHLSQQLALLDVEVIREKAREHLNHSVAEYQLANHGGVNPCSVPPPPTTFGGPSAEIAADTVPPAVVPPEVEL